MPEKKEDKKKKVVRPDVTSAPIKAKPGIVPGTTPTEQADTRSAHPQPQPQTTATEPTPGDAQV